HRPAATLSIPPQTVNQCSTPPSPPAPPFRFGAGAFSFNALLGHYLTRMPLDGPLPLKVACLFVSFTRGVKYAPRSVHPDSSYAGGSRQSCWPKQARGSGVCHQGTLHEVR